MKYFLITFFCLQISYSQNVSIQLKFQNVTDSIPIVVSKSINDDAAYFLYHSDTIYTKNNRAELKFDASNPGYLYFVFSKAMTFWAIEEFSILSSVFGFSHIIPFS